MVKKTRGNKGLKKRIIKRIGPRRWDGEWTFNGDCRTSKDLPDTSKMNHVDVVKPYL